MTPIFANLNFPVNSRGDVFRFFTIFGLYFLVFLSFFEDLEVLGPGGREEEFPPSFVQNAPEGPELRPKIQKR